jgi:transcriptional regulator with XRE-family HTH domain
MSATMAVEKFGDRLKRLRLERKLTQKKLAEDAGVRQQHIARWEAGVEPSLPSAVALAKALGTSLDALLDDVVFDSPD